MRSFHNLFFASAILLYTSCAENPSTQNPATDSGSVKPLKETDTTTEAVVQEEEFRNDTSSELLQNWQKEMQDTGINLELKNFYRSGMNEFSLYDQGEWNGEVGNNFVSSPNNRYYSFEYSSWPDGDADTYVHLIDRVKKRQYIVEVLGTCCSYAGTGWLNDSTLVAIGYDAYEAEEKYPGKYLAQGLYTIFDLKTGRSTYYRSRNFFRRPCNCGPTN